MWVRGFIPPTFVLAGLVPAIQFAREQRFGWNRGLGASPGRRGFLRGEPALADCDTICDLSDYTGDVTTDYMASVAMLMNELRASERSVRTALVSCDDGFTSWAQVMNHQFVGRHFQVFGSVRAAEAWLLACCQGCDAA